MKRTSTNVLSVCSFLSLKEGDLTIWARIEPGALEEDEDATTQGPQPSPPRQAIRQRQVSPAQNAVDREQPVKEEHADLLEDIDFDEEMDQSLEIQDELDNEEEFLREVEAAEQASLAEIKQAKKANVVIDLSLSDSDDG